MIDAPPQLKESTPKVVGNWKKWMPCTHFSSAIVSESVNNLSLQNNWQIEWYESLSQGQAAWQSLAASHNLFLSTEYFQLIEELDLGAVTSGLAIFCHPDHGRFGLVLQTFTFDARDQMGKLDDNAQHGFWNGLVTSLTKKLGKLLRFNILAAGQLLLTGPNGIKAMPELAKDDLSSLLAEGLEAVAAQMSMRIHAIMLKDLDLGENPKNNRFHTLPVQPNMVMELPSEWENFDNYLDAMSSKYRVRVRRARKKGKEIERVELDLNDLQIHQAEMHRLYKIIADQSDFNSAVLPPDYFYKWKKHFPTRFRIWGYFYDEELIGFSSAVYNEHEFEAHYIGFDSQYNRSHQLYLNMLYDFVDEAISSESSKLIFSRTALAIKSSVGATPEELHCWIKSRVVGANPIVPIVAKIYCSASRVGSSASFLRRKKLSIANKNGTRTCLTGVKKPGRFDGKERME